MAAHFDVYAIDGTTYLGRLSEFASAALQEEHNGPGSLSLDYPTAGNASSLIDLDEALLVPVVDGEIQPDWYLLEDDNDDPAKQPKAENVVTVSGRGALALFEDPVVFPQDYVPGGPVINLDPKQEFGDATPGAIMHELISRAKARNALQNVTYDFTDVADSNGVPWPTNYTITYDAGSDYLKVLQGFADGAWADFRMNGLTLQMYVPDTVRGIDRPNVIFRLGEHVTQGPRVRSRRTKRSDMLLVGDEGALAQAHAANYVGRRREGYDGRGGVTDLGTLQAIGNVEVNLTQVSAESITLVYVAGAAGAPQPYVAYNPGDFVRYDQRRKPDNTGWTPLRVRTIARQFTPDGIASTSIELNDVIIEIAARMQRKIDAILNGSTSNTRAPQPPKEGPDFTIPAAPETVDASSASYTDAAGQTHAQATISWLPVTENTDGSAFDDFGAYEVEWNIDGHGWTGGTTLPDQTVYYVSPLPVGATLQARVRADDFSGNWGEWTESEVILLAEDETPPNKPSAPTVEPWLGVLRVTWDGLDLNGDPMPADFAHLDVYQSNANNFAIDDPGVTLVDSLTNAGVSVLVGAVDDDVYVRFVAVDRSGNPSIPSDIAHGVLEPLVAADIIDGAITEAKIATDAVSARAIATGAVGTTEIFDAAIVSAKIADGTIITAKIADATITGAKIVDATIQSAKIASLDVGKLTAGILNVDVTVSARIKTADNGPRSEMNSTGFHLFSNTGEVLTAAIVGGIPQISVVGGTITGATITGGVIQTATNGARWVLSSSTFDQLLGYTNNAADTPGVLLMALTSRSSTAGGGPLQAGTARVIISSPVLAAGGGGASVGIGSGSAGLASQIMLSSEEIYHSHSGVRSFYFTPADGLVINASTIVSGSFGVYGGLFLGSNIAGGGYTISNVTITGATIQLPTISQPNIGSGGQWTGGPTLGGTVILSGFPTVSSGTANMLLGASGAINKIVPSFRAWKTNIVPLDTEMDRLVTLLDLPKRFDYKKSRVSDAHLKSHWGLIIEDLQEAGLSELVALDENGDPADVAYDRVGVAVLPVVRDLRERLAKMERALANA